MLALHLARVDAQKASCKFLNKVLLVSVLLTSRQTTTLQEKEGRITFVPSSYVEGKPISGKTK